MQRPKLTDTTSITVTKLMRDFIKSRAYKNERYEDYFKREWKEEWEKFLNDKKR